MLRDPPSRASRSRRASIVLLENLVLFLVIAIYLCIPTAIGYADDEDPWASPSSSVENDNGLNKNHNYGPKMFIEDDPDVINARKSITTNEANSRANIWVATRESDNVKLQSLGKSPSKFQ